MRVTQTWVAALSMEQFAEGGNAPGCRRLYSGNGTRLASGGVLAQMTSLNVKAGGRTETKLVMRENKDEVQVIGNFHSESLFTTLEGGNKQSLLQACGRGYFVVGILGVNQEPTNHALRDISALKTDLEKWG